MNLRGNRSWKRLDRVVGGLAIVLLAPFVRRGAGRLPPSPRKILVVKLAAMGDVVLLAPTLRALRRSLPDAEIDFLGTPATRGAVGLFPDTRVRFLDLEVGRLARDPLHLFRLARRLRAERYEVALDFEQWPRLTPLLLALAGIPQRLGFRTRSRFRHLLYTRTAPRVVTAHESRNFARIAEALQVHAEPGDIRIVPSPAGVSAARAFLENAGRPAGARLILIHPGCGHAHARAWPIDRYEELVARLAGGPDAPFLVFTGTGEERALVQRLAEVAGPRGAAAPEGDLQEFVALLDQADLVISGNTGTMHLAAALGRRQLVLEGPNDPAKWGPLNDAAVIVRSSCPDCPCLDLGFEFHRTDGFCMEQISVEQVLAHLPQPAAR